MGNTRSYTPKNQCPCTACSHVSVFNKYSFFGLKKGKNIETLNLSTGCFPCFKNCIAIESQPTKVHLIFYFIYHMF